jgi:sugar lactone lactonase YvrE
MWPLVSLLALTIPAAVCHSQDSYVVLDRATERGLFLVESTGTITAITPTVPWQHADSVARDVFGNLLVTVNVSDAFGTTDGVYRVSPAGTVTSVAVGDAFDAPRGIAIDAAGRYVVLNYRYKDGKCQILRVDPAGQVEILSEDRPLRQPIGIAIDRHGDYIITDRASAGRIFSIWTELPENGAVYRFNPVTRLMTTVRSSVDANDNVKLDELMGHLTGVAIDSDGNYIIIESPPHLDDNGNWKTPIGDTYLLRMHPDGEILQTIHVPTLDDVYTIGLDVAIDGRGDYIVADAAGTTSSRGRLLRVTPQGQVSSIILTPVLGLPGGVVVLPGAPPQSPQIVHLSLVPGADQPRICFSWKSELGRSYRIQQALTLNGPDWQDLAFPISGTGNFIEFSHQCAGATSGFFRIRLVSPAGVEALAPEGRELISGPRTPAGRVQNL